MRFEVRNAWEVAGENGQLRRWRAADCMACGGAIVIESNHQTDAFMAAYPERIGNWEVLHLDGAVARDWAEAIKVFDVGAHQAAVVACGRTLEAATDQVGIEGRSLQQRIGTLLAMGIISPAFKEAMTYVRLIRNTGAHAGQDVTAESALGTMRFTQQALRLMFEVPGELGRLRPDPPEAEDGDVGPPEHG